LEVEILLMKETRIRVAMAVRTMTMAGRTMTTAGRTMTMAGRTMTTAGRTMTIAKVEEQRAKKYSKITNGMFV
jgi:hypothetical protein